MATVAPRTEEPLSADEFARFTPRIDGYLHKHFDRLGDDERDLITNDALMDLVRARERKSGELRGEAAAWSYLEEAVRSHAIRRIRAATNPARSAELLDPSAELFVGRPDESADPAAAFEAAVSDADVADMLGKLGTTQRKVVWLRDIKGMKPSQICSELKISRKRYEKVPPRAYKLVAEELAAKDPDRFDDASMTLIADVMSGVADQHRVTAFNRLMKVDRFRDQVAQYEATYQALLGAIPADAMLRAEGGGGLLERFSAAIEHPREFVASALGRAGGEATHEGLAQASAAGGARGAGATAAGALGLAGLGGAGKAAVAVCVGASAVCVAAVVPGAHVPGLGGDGDGVDEAARAERAAQVEQIVEPPRGPLEPLPEQSPAPEQASGEDAEGSEESSASAAETASAASVPTPAEQEFDPLAGAAPTTAPSTSSGGGSTSSGGGAASQEFARP